MPNIHLSVISYQLSVISYQLSVISYQLSVISYQLSVIIISYHYQLKLCFSRFDVPIFAKNLNIIIKSVSIMIISAISVLSNF